MDNPPLAGLRVVEFTHMVMGPAAGAILCELGCEVIRVEPPGGDATRRLLGSGAGYFPMYNRGKKSVCLDLKTTAGLEAATLLAASADIVIENFRPGAMDRLGLGYGAFSELNPRLIYCSEKGFLPGPYEHRTALDEVAQMMGGLAYMTGPPGRPLRAGASVIDVTGGMFGVIGILAAVEARHRTGTGAHIQSALFETTAYLVGQHIAQHAVTGTPAAPMPVRVSAWAIYDVFETADDKQLFVGVVTDALWAKFCALFELDALWSDLTLRTNNARVAARTTILPVIRAALGAYSLAELIARLDGSGLPFAPIGRPEDLTSDPHLRASGGLEDVAVGDSSSASLPVLPISINGERTSAGNLAATGENNVEVFTALGFDDAQLARIRSPGVA